MFKSSYIAFWEIHISRRIQHGGLLLNSLVLKEEIVKRSRFTRQSPIVAAATVFPKFLKFWSPPHDLAWFLIMWILEPFGRALILDGFEDYLQTWFSEIAHIGIIVDHRFRVCFAELKMGHAFVLCKTLFERQNSFNRCQI